MYSRRTVARRKPQRSASQAAQAIAQKLSVGLNDRGRFSAWMKHRYFLRIHMTLILVATFLSGMVATKLMQEAHLNKLWLRYAVAVLFAYGAFLLLIKCWLIYLGIRARRQRATLTDLPSDFADAVCDLGNVGFDWSGDFGGGGGSSVSDAFEGGGGSFGGGGASGSWGIDAEDVAKSVTVPSPGGGSGGGGGFDLDLGGDDGVIILVIALVVAIVVAGIWMIYAAPAILSEAAFEAMLASALLKKAKQAGEGNWVGSVIKSTILPFLVIAALSTAVGYYAQKSCPAATRLREALLCAH